MAVFLFGGEKMLPREKLQQHGAETLSEDELLAIILGTGGKDENVFDLSKRILSQIENVANLKNLEYEELITIKGIKKAKATKIIASIELAKRIFKYNPKEIRLNTSKDTFEYLKYDFYGKKQEEFMVLFLDKRMRLIKKKMFALGNGNMICVDVKEIMKHALKLSAECLIIVHNHPSNYLKPSEEDIECTKKIDNAAKLLDIVLIDHVIMGQDGYYSFIEHHKLSS